MLITVVLLNLLIAVMQDSYDKIKEQEQIEGLREKGTVATILLASGLHSSKGASNIVADRRRSGCGAVWWTRQCPGWWRTTRP